MAKIFTITVMFTIPFIAQASELTIDEARQAACDSAVKLGWTLQISCEADFARIQKETATSYVFRSNVEASGCEARIIVDKASGQTEGHVGCY